MGGSQQANAAAEIMRAVMQSGGQSRAGHAKTAREPAPFADIRLDHADGGGGNGRFKRGDAAHVLPGGQRKTAGCGQAGPFFRRAVAGQRLFHPEQRIFPQAGQNLQSLLQSPGLIGVHRQPLAGQQGIQRRADIGLILLASETDLHLEGPVARFAHAVHGFSHAGMINAAGVGGHGRHGRVAQQFMQRRARAPGGQIPERNVQTGQSLIHGAGLVRLKAQNVQLAGHMAHQLTGFMPGCAKRGRQHCFRQQTTTVLRATGREIAPGFAPAPKTVLILHAQQHGGPVAHDAERGAHRLINRSAQNKNFRGAQGCGG